MLPTYVVVLDSTRARFFSPEMGDGAGGEISVRLTEKKTLINPDRLVRSGQLFTGSRSDSLTRSNGLTYTVDDRRDRHVLEIERRFAGEIARELTGFSRSRNEARVLIAAGPHMLGLLRDALDGLVEKSRIIEHNADLSHLGAAQILEHVKADLG